jgi:HD-like signal output (HDOD) protein
MENTNDKATKIAKEVLHSRTNLPVLPESGPKLIEMAQKPIDKIDVAKLSKLIENDPAMVAKILRIANSAYYGALSRMSSLRQAIMHIGLEETLNTVTWLFYQKALPKFPNIEGFSDRDYWNHSWACATANKMLGHPRLQTNPLPGELYITGLLHGIGKLFLALCRPDDFLTSIRTAQDTDRALFEAEMEVIGTTDGHVAFEVLKKWRLPLHICQAVKNYSTPEDAPDEYREIASLTQYAYFIANASGIGSVSDSNCVDLENTLIWREGETPLSQQKTRETYVEDIFKTLREKSQTILNLDTEEEGDQEELAEEQEYISQARRNPRKQGFFSWLLSFFR